MTADIDEMAVFDEALGATQVQDLFAGGSGTTPPPAPVNRWTFEEGSGTASAAAVGGSTATLQNGTQWVAGRQGSYAVQLDGTDDQVSLGLADRTGDWAVVSWVTRSPDRPSSALLANSAAAVKLEQWNNTHTIGYTQFGVADSQSGYGTPLGQWVHLAVVRSGSQLSVYADGALRSTVPAGGALPLSWLGRRGTSSPSDAAAAAFDDVGVYDTALTSAQVAQVFASS